MHIPEYKKPEVIPYITDCFRFLFIIPLHKVFRYLCCIALHMFFFYLCKLILHISIFPVYTRGKKGRCFPIVATPS